MPSDEFAPATRLADLVERFGRLLRSERRRGGLDPAQWESLAYLARANRYSVRPSAVAEFLGATKGTTSQTLNALERKGLIARRADARDGRVVVLGLTPAGRRMLARDPGVDLAASLTAPARAALVRGLTELLRGVQRRNGLKPFGQCRDCRFFRERKAAGEAGGPHRCGLTGEPLAEFESLQICAEQRPRGPIAYFA